MFIRFLLILCISITDSFVLNNNFKPHINCKRNKNGIVSYVRNGIVNNIRNSNAVIKMVNNLESLENLDKSKIFDTSPNYIIEKINNRELMNSDTWSYNELVNHLNTIKSAVIVGNQNVGLFYDKSDSEVHIFKYLPNMLDNLIDIITKKGIDYQVYDVSLPQPFEVPFIIQLFATYILVSVLFNFIMSRNGGGGGGGIPMNPFNSMKKSANMVESGEITTKFEDVAGLNEAKEELEEIVDYLRNPLKYTFAGAKIPKGVLLEGPPGTGKTLLARAVAGEAGVSFISASGSEFIEMFVGVGAQRVRNLFKQAAENKPCVIFIDEIDAVGGRRGYGFNSGGNDEREQTLNQILTNMDGFEKSDGIIVLAATNRADTLDPALKRSGRFDRKVQVSLPDLQGRKEIAKVHFKNKPNVSIDYDNLAVLTAGFSGADLATLANEATLLGVRNNATMIEDSVILRAFEKMTIGLPKKYDTRTIQTKNLVACHEIGHAMMIKHYNTYFKLQRVTMNANTAGAGGYTLFTPKDFYAEYSTKGYFIAQIVVALGGRAAEIIYFRNQASKCNMASRADRENRENKSDQNKIYDELDKYKDIEITAGASNDIRQANSIAKKYLELFENYIVPESISDSTQNLIDFRVSELIKDCLEISVNLIKQNQKEFQSLTQKLLQENTIVF